MILGPPLVTSYLSKKYIYVFFFLNKKRKQKLVWQVGLILKYFFSQTALFKERNWPDHFAFIGFCSLLNKKKKIKKRQNKQITKLRLRLELAYLNFSADFFA